MRQRSAKMRIIKVKVHAGVEGNEGADEQADKGALLRTGYRRCELEVPVMIHAEIRSSGVREGHGFN